MIMPYKHNENNLFVKKQRFLIFFSINTLLPVPGQAESCQTERMGA